jgi:predicted dehydrogenase
MDNNYVSRRQLIQGLSAIAGSAALNGLVPWISLLKADVPSNISANDKVNLAVLGPGSRGRLLLKHLLNIPSVNVVAVCDDYPLQLKRAIELTKGKAKKYTDYRKMLEQKDIDGVVIATPLHLHAKMSIDCFHADKHVFCEKSLTKTVDEAARLNTVRKTTGKILHVGHQRMFDIRYLKAFEDIKAGKIGKITQIRAYWHRNSNWRRRVPRPELERKINWRMYREYSLGLMTELASHHLQVANWFLESEPLSVRGSGSINYWRDGREVFDNVNLVYEYPDGVHFIYDSMISNKHYGLEFQVMGDKGTLELETGKLYSEKPPDPPGIRQLINDLEHSIFDTLPLGGASWIPETASNYKGDWIVDIKKSKIPDSTALSLEAFVESIRNNEPIAGMAEQGLLSALACIAGDEAMVRNEVIDFSKKASI